MRPRALRTYLTTGRWLAALAVWLLVLAGTVMPGLALAATAGTAPICHDSGAPAGHGAPSPLHDCVACPLCNALAAIHAVPVPAAPVVPAVEATAPAPSPAVILALRPLAWRIAARPRGPPHPVLAAVRAD